MSQDTAVTLTPQASREQSGDLVQHCVTFLLPLLRELNRQLDRRLVQTFLDLVVVIVLHRHRNQGLVLSELGAHLLGAAHAPAGVKRIANLLHSIRWSGRVVEDFLWAQAEQGAARTLGHAKSSAECARADAGSDPLTVEPPV